MPKFKTGDRVRIIRGRDNVWYKHHIGYECTIGINPTTLHEREYWYLKEKPNYTVHASDIELVTEGEQMDKEITTDEAILQLQSLLDVCLDDSVSIIIKPTKMSVKAFGKEYAVANAEELEQVCKAVSYLSGMEIE